MSSTITTRKRILFISPHVPVPPTDGGMVRTYSLVKAFSRDWEIHYIALENSSDVRSQPNDSKMAEIFPNLIVTKCLAGLGPNLVEILRPNKLAKWFIKLRDALKKNSFANILLSMLNFPYKLGLILRKYQRARRFVRDYLSRTTFDAVLFDYTKMAHYSTIIADRSVRKILNVHNAESDLSHQILNSLSGFQWIDGWLRWQLHRGFEKYFVPKCNFVLASSDADAKFHRSLSKNIKTIVIPNAVDTDELKPLPPPEEPLSLIYPGRMDYPPNSEAVQYFCREILPKVARIVPGVRLYVVGKNPPPSLRQLQSDRVEIIGYVENMIPFWRKAAILVAPLQAGSGTRIKILEAMALGRPVVSTCKGCEGLDVTHGKGILIADDASTFVRETVRLLRDPGLYRQLRSDTRILVEERYSFKVVEQLIDKAFHSNSF